MIGQCAEESGSFVIESVAVPAAPRTGFSLRGLVWRLAVLAGLSIAGWLLGVLFATEAAAAPASPTPAPSTVSTDHGDAWTPNRSGSDQPGSSSGALFGLAPVLRQVHDGVHGAVTSSEQAVHRTADSVHAVSDTVVPENVVPEAVVPEAVDHTVPDVAVPPVVDGVTALPTASHGDVDTTTPEGVTADPHPAAAGDADDAAPAPPHASPARAGPAPTATTAPAADAAPPTPASTTPVVPPSTSPTAASDGSSPVAPAAPLGGHGPAPAPSSSYASSHDGSYCGKFVPGHTPDHAPGVVVSEGPSAGGDFARARWARPGLPVTAPG